MKAFLDIDRTIQIDSDRKFGTILGPIKSTCSHILNMRNLGDLTGIKVIDSITHPNLAYLKFLAIDIVEILEEYFNATHKQAVETAKEYGSETHYEFYMKNLGLTYSKEMTEEETVRRQTIDAIYVHRSLVWRQCADKPHITKLMEVVKLCMDVERHTAGQNYLYLTYPFAIYSPKVWIYQDMNLDSDALRHILSGIIPEGHPVKMTIHQANKSICSRLLTYLKEVTLKYGLREPHVVQMIYSEVIFIMSLLHVAHVSALCRTFKTSDYSEHFIRLANDLDIYIASVVEWKLPQCEN